jgi:hypothetical protein
MSNTSTTMFRRALLSSRLATPVECTARTIRPAFTSYRQVSSSTRLPTLTASETRRRPTVRPFQQPSSQGGVNSLSPTSKRTIFIQTENTPNPDVSTSAQSSPCLSGFPINRFSIITGPQIYPQPPRPPRRLPQLIPGVPHSSLDPRPTTPISSRGQIARC